MFLSAAISTVEIAVHPRQDDAQHSFRDPGGIAKVWRNHRSMGYLAFKDWEPTVLPPVGDRISYAHG